MRPEEQQDDLIPDDFEFDDLFGPSPAPEPEPTIRFLHHNLKASKHLGLPDSPVIHLAVSNVVSLLMPNATGTRLSDEQAEVQALRTASRTVLESLPIECAVEMFKERLDLPMGAELMERMYRSVRTDWLLSAKNAILEAGEHTGPDVSRSATRYGWTMPLESGIGSTGP